MYVPHTKVLSGSAIVTFQRISKPAQKKLGDLPNAIQNADEKPACGPLITGELLEGC